MSRRFFELAIAAVIAGSCMTTTAYAGAAPPLGIHMERGGEAGVIRGDLAAAGLPGMKEASVIWRDYDRDGDQDLVLIGADGSGRITRVYRNESGGIFKAVAGCTETDGVTTCEGDVPEGVWVGSYDNLARGSLQSMRLYQDALAQRMDAARSNPFPGRNAPGGMAFEGGNGVWLSGVRQGADQDAAGGYLSHNFTTSVGLGGYERSLGRSIVGVSFGTTRTDVDRDNDMAIGSSDGIGGSVYAGHVWGRSFAYGILSYTRERYENRRDVHVGREERIARSNYDGSVFSALATGGRRLDVGRWGLEPFASVRFARLSEDGFSESGAGSVNLLVDSGSSNQLTSDIGIRFSRSFSGDRSAWVPELLLGWSHDFGLEDRRIVAAFAGDPDMTFAIEGQDTKRDGATAGVGLSYLTAGGWKAGLRYDRAQRSDYQANSLSFRLGSTF